MKIYLKSPKGISCVLSCSLFLSTALFFGVSFLTNKAEISCAFLLLKMVLKFCVFFIPAFLVMLFFRQTKTFCLPSGEKASLHKNLLLILSSFGVIVIIQMLYAAVFPSAMATVGVSEEHSFFENFLLFISIALVPAIAEEIFFRGAMLRAMGGFRNSLGILMSALFFALMHFSVSFFPVAFVCGLILGMAYVATRSLFAVIGIHFLCNAFWFLAETVNVYMSDAYAAFMRIAIVFCVLLSSAGLPFLKENMIEFFRDNGENAVPSSQIWTFPMILFIAFSAGVQIFLM